MDVARGLFAERGLDGTSVEEIAGHAQVSKPVVYEHFGGKEGLYSAVVAEDMRTLHDAIAEAISRPRTDPRTLIELGTLALLDYIEENPDGFRILSRDSNPFQPAGSFQTILSAIASRVEGLLAAQFERRGYDPETAPLYAQMLVGLVALAGQWWVDARVTSGMNRPEVAAHLVNLAWNGMRNLDVDPRLRLEELPHEGEDDEGEDDGAEDDGDTGPASPDDPEQRGC